MDVIKVTKVPGTLNRGCRRPPNRHLESVGKVPGTLLVFGRRID